MKTKWHFNGFSGVDIRLTTSYGLNIYISNIYFDTELKKGAFVPRATMRVPNFHTIDIVLIGINEYGKATPLGKLANVKYESEDGFFTLHEQTAFSFEEAAIEEALANVDTTPHLIG